MKFYNTPEEDKQYVWNEAKKNDRVAQKLLKAYKKRKRAAKIQKLVDSDSHWEGLS